MVDFQPPEREELTDATTSLNRISSLPIRGFPELQSNWDEVSRAVKDFIRSEEYSAVLGGTPVPSLLNNTLGMVRLVLMASAGRKASATDAHSQSNSEFEARTLSRLKEKLSDLKTYSSDLELDTELDWKRPFKALVKEIDEFCETFLDKIQSDS